MSTTMSAISADSVMYFDPLPEPWHRNRAAGWALAISLFVHALTIAFLPGLRVVQPQPKVITVSLAPQPAQQHATTPQPAEKPAAAPVKAAAAPKVVSKQPAVKQPAAKPSPPKPFQRQDLQPTPSPAQVPQPARAEPRPRLAPAPSTEPNAQAKPESARATIARA